MKITSFIAQFTALLLSFGGVAHAADNSLNCPAIAAGTSDSITTTCKGSLGPTQKAICEYKPKKWTDNLPLLDSTVGVSYVRDLRSAGVGTPVCRQLVNGHKAYQVALRQCGANGNCVLQVMRNWSWDLAQIEKSLRVPIKMSSLQQFAGKTYIQDGSTTVPLLERLKQGMDLFPLPRLALKNGNELIWGFQPHNAQVQSLMILNHQGDVQVMGLVDNLYLGMSGGQAPAGLDPEARLSLLVRNPAALSENLPAIHAWAAASLLGFNQTCPGKDQQACQAAMAQTLPIKAYNLNCKVKPQGNILVDYCTLPLPSVKNDVSPGLFWQ